MIESNFNRTEFKVRVKYNEWITAYRWCRASLEEHKWSLSSGMTTDTIEKGLYFIFCNEKDAVMFELKFSNTTGE